MSAGIEQLKRRADALQPIAQDWEKNTRAYAWEQMPDNEKITEVKALIQLMAGARGETVSPSDVETMAGNIIKNVSKDGYGYIKPRNITEKILSELPAEDRDL